MAGRDDIGAMQTFVSSYGVDGLSHVVDEDGSLWERFGVITQPSFAFIDDGGSIEVHTGRLGAEELASRVEALRSA